MAIRTAHIIDECYSNLEDKVADGNMVAKYNLFIIEVLKRGLRHVIEIVNFLQVSAIMI